MPSNTVPHPTNISNIQTSLRHKWVFLTLLLIISTWCQIDRILPFVLAESIKRDLVLSDTQLGLITGVSFAVYYTLASLPLARAADRGSPRLVLTLCILIWSAMTSLGAFSTSALFLAITRFGVAFGESGAIPSGHALIAREITPERRGAAIGLFAMGLPLGTMLGFGTGGWINDTIGWRSALFYAGGISATLAVMVLLILKPTPHLKITDSKVEPFLQSARRLLCLPTFLWLFIAANCIGFASAPFYAFVTPFLIRTHGFSASEAGLAFGPLQGLLGLLGTAIGGREFDKAIQSGHKQLLLKPAIVFLTASLTTTAALFAPAGWMSIALFIPSMFSLAYLLPWAFGASHLIAGPGKQALASSLVLIGSGLLGPTVGPLLVGVLSDTALTLKIENGLRWGLLLVPLASFASGIAILIANKKLEKHLSACSKII